MSDVIPVSKVDAAHRQLVTAVELYADERDPISIHTLTGAARELISDLGKARGLPTLMFPDRVEHLIKPDYRKTFRKVLREAQNFLKHADEDPDRILEFRPAGTEVLLFDACLAYRALTGQLSRLLLGYAVWVSLNEPKLVTLPDEASAKLAEAAATLIPRGRRAFFDGIRSLDALAG